MFNPRHDSCYTYLVAAPPIVPANLGISKIARFHGCLDIHLGGHHRAKAKAKARAKAKWHLSIHYMGAANAISFA